MFNFNPCNYYISYRPYSPNYGGGEPMCKITTIKILGIKVYPHACCNGSLDNCYGWRKIIREKEVKDGN